MKHLGDITKINGGEIETVDCIIGGSPCQDLSVAGKRAGLAGARSGLYMEQIRIIKEMREAYGKNTGRTDGFCKCRYMVWENVPGAFSSNKGRDFAAVLEEAIRVVEPEAPDVPVPEKGWPTAGCLYDDLGKWSIAWRVHDAQFWGTPQRRKRIALVADFGGLTAPEVLFERKGLSRYSAESFQAWQGAASNPQAGAGGHDKKYVRNIVAGFSGGQGAAAGGIGYAVECSPTIKAAAFGSNMVPDVLVTFNIGSYYSKAWLDGKPNTGVYETEKARTLDAINCGNPACNQGGTAVVMTQQAFGAYKEVGVASSCKRRDYKDATDLVVNDYMVRRLTPLECERLQGFPDGWTDIGDWVDSKGKKHKESDSPRYKALGNSIAVGYANNQSGFWMWLLKRISAQYERSATMGSLFDGIGGFPLAWEFFNGKGSARWASEIEEFPIAVTKYHFPEEKE